MQLPARVGIAGGGLMGSGIAAVIARAGRDVVVFDADPAAATRVGRSCEDVLSELVSAGALSGDEAREALQRIVVATTIDGLREVPFVIEAVTESLEIKHPLYRDLEATLDASTVIASSTSGFTPDSLAEPLRHRGRFLVAHFWNPPHLIPLVEVVGCSETSPEALDATLDLLKACACEPVVLAKAVPGFIGNRFQFAILREALHLLQEGVADAPTIDAVLRQSLGRRYRWFGPLEGADLGGLDTFLRISRHLMPQLAAGEASLAPLEQLVSDGHRGRSSGGGFYRWDRERDESWLQRRQKMLRDRVREG